MEIRNEIKQKDEDKKQFVHRSLAEVQRAKLNKLMENPVKLINSALIKLIQFVILGQASCYSRICQ